MLRPWPGRELQRYAGAVLLTSPLRTCVLQVPPFDPSRTLGGAEVIAVELVRALASAGEVTVLHGYGPGAVPAVPRRFPRYPAGILPSFPLDDHVRHHGNIQPRLTAAASDIIAAADVLVTIERTLNLPCAARRITMLGGVGYPHTHDVLASGAWDRLVVPSPFTARQVTRHVPGATGIVVLPNGVDVTQFRPAVTPPARGSRVRLLLACRPSWDKGFRRAFALARQMEDKGIPVQVTCFDQPDGLGEHGFTDAVKAEATGVLLEIRPWASHSQMPAIYQAADLTLCLGDAEEGFGLAAAESVAAGTPVLATSVGFLAEMLPPDHGIFLVPREAEGPELLDLARQALTVGRQQCLAAGRPYVAAHYGLDRMCDEMVRIAAEVSS
jgi:glycosyltransferase involved in cell wall biosynthesis